MVLLGVVLALRLLVTIASIILVLVKPDALTLEFFTSYVLTMTIFELSIEMVKSRR